MTVRALGCAGVPSLPFTPGYPSAFEVEVQGCSEEAPDCGTIAVRHVTRRPLRKAGCEHAEGPSELGCSGEDTGI